MTWRERMPTAGVVVALVALVAWSAWTRWQVLDSSPFPLGVDGYFYPLEVRGLLEHGTLPYPASPLVLWWMAPFAAATDPIVGAKLGAALGGALIAVPAYGVGRRLGGGRPAGMIAAAVATSSAGSMFLTIEFVKQGVGLTVALAALWAVLAACSRTSRARIGGAVAAIGATLLAHKLAAAIVVGAALPIAIEEARGRGVLRGRRLIYAIMCALGAVLGLVVAGALLPQRLPSLGDLGLVRGLLTTHARWDGAALATPGFTLRFEHEAAIGGVLAIGAGYVLATVRGERPRGDRVAAWIFVGIGVLIAVPWLDVSDPQGLGFRLRCAAFVPLAMCAAIVGGAIAGIVREATWLVAAAAVAIAAVPRDRDEGKVTAHPALVAAAQALADHVPRDATLVVGERQVEFMVAWYTRAPVAARPERVPYARRARVLLPLSPVNVNFPLGPALEAARREPLLDPPISLHPDARDGFVLVTEPTWDFILAQLPARSRAYYVKWPTI